MKRYVKSALSNPSIEKLTSEARNKSIQIDGLVKVWRGFYYYKGWRVCNDGYPAYPWNAFDHRRYDEHMYGVGTQIIGKTLREVIQDIDWQIENEQSNQ